MSAQVPLGEVAARLGHRFREPRWLATAITHPTAAVEEGGEHYQRLEFLGDAVLGLITAEWLFRRVEEAEGELSRLKAWLVSEAILAARVRRLELADVLRLGVGEEKSGGRDKDSILAALFEAILGALYLDGGLAAARAFAEPHLEEALRTGRPDARREDPKTTLQEALQAAGRPVPEYRVVDEWGPDHDKRFVVECRVGDEVLARGSGASKKRAEKVAAAAALDRLDAAG